ncbi:unnamed protein product [Phytophthora fragariaefolia]|uniref:Unnamed protein product n=1 Tax=Phytophthora fragariaefolia TaxID=1490495 RepID=A0A9W7CP05_9STRA|nr:unnamed protein product [Phytophthora fragariaefolia]
MASTARRGAMPHHRVPDRKETPLVLERLRSELNWNVRRRVSEAVDAVCEAFEDELARLVPPEAPPVAASYEQFYDCCSRLMHFIASNLSTTPGFMEEMDRLILACHSGASGQTLRQVMTKDLQICRRQKSRDKEDGDGRSGEDAVSTGKISLAGGDEDGEDKPANTVGTASRQWATRKRLSTRNHSSGRGKRLKSSLEKDSGGGENNEAKQEDGADVEKKKDGKAQERKQEGAGKKTKKTRYAPALSRRMRMAKLAGKRAKCIRQRDKDFEDLLDEHNNADNECNETENSQDVGNAARRKEARVIKLGRKQRWRLSGAAMTVSNKRGSQQIDEDSEAGAQGYEATQGTAGKDSPMDEAGAVAEATQNTDMDSEQNVRTGKSPIETSPESAPTSEPDQEIPAEELSTVELAVDVDSAVIEFPLLGSDEEENKRNNDNEAGRKLGFKVIRESQQESSQGIKDHEQPSEVVQATKERGNPIIFDETGIIDLTEEEDQPLDVKTELQTISDQSGSTNSCEVGNLQQMSQNELLSLVAIDIASLAEMSSLQVEHTNRDIDSVKADDELPVPGLCDAGMRPASDINHFKASLRKAIQFVDAIMCRPPPGKSCCRNCEDIRRQQCREGASCHNKLCRNWHDAEAHMERCKNPLCEFRNRILLREIMHRIANLDVDTQNLRSQWESKTLELIVATTANSYRLNEDNKQLDIRIRNSKEEMESLNNTKIKLVTNLSAIGVNPQNDKADRFPDFENHFK